MIDRHAALRAIRDQYETTLWGLAREISKSLGGLALTPHFDASDDRAVGSAIHSTLPSAAVAAGLEAAGLRVEAAYDCFTFQPPGERTQRIAWVARRP